MYNFTIIFFQIQKFKKETKMNFKVNLDVITIKGFLIAL
jgi:hypothetical protein